MRKFEKREQMMPRMSPLEDVNGLIEQLCGSSQFQYRLEQKLNNLLENRTRTGNPVIAFTGKKGERQSDKIIEEISVVIETLIKNNLQTIVDLELRALKDDVWKLKEEIKSQGLSIDYLKRKVDKGNDRGDRGEREQAREPLSFGQPRADQEGETRNRFQILRKPGNLVVTSGGGSTTYTTLNSISTPTHHQYQPHPKQQSPAIPPALANEITKLKVMLQTPIDRILDVNMYQLRSQISLRVNQNQERIKSQLEAIVKNSDTRFQYTETSIKKHMQRSLESLWKMITSIKTQLEDMNSELQLNQSGIMMN